MQLTDAKNLALNLMEQHGLLNMGWSLEFDNAKRRFGVCRYRTKRIGLSKDLVLLNSEAKVKDTILHEIAHALTPGHGHNNVWRRKAIEIGCDGNRCYSTNEVETPESRYIAVCDGCGTVHKKHKMTESLKRKRRSCGICSPGRFNPMFEVIFVPNPNF